MAMHKDFIVFFLRIQVQLDVSQDWFEYPSSLMILYAYFSHLNARIEDQLLLLYNYTPNIVVRLSLADSYIQRSHSRQSKTTVALVRLAYFFMICL